MGILPIIFVHKTQPTILENSKRKDDLQSNIIKQTQNEIQFKVLQLCASRIRYTGKKGKGITKWVNFGHRDAKHQCTPWLLSAPLPDRSFDSFGRNGSAFRGTRALLSWKPAPASWRPRIGTFTSRTTPREAPVARLGSGA